MAGSPQRVAPAGRSEALAGAATFGLFLSLPVVICWFRNIATDPDVWWHLRAAQWILQHRTWPVADSFSSFGAGKPWLAYSWLPELILYGLYQALGLRGLVFYTAALFAVTVAAFHRLTRRLQRSALLSVALTFVAAFGLMPLQKPRPWLFSILFLVIELDLLLAAGRTGNRRRLLWLVPLFALWANMHIQFVLGLVVLGLAVAESVLVRAVAIPIADDDSRRMPVGWMLSLFTLCGAATLINPYHYHLYEVAFQLVGQSGLWNVIQELRAMPFRSCAHWTVLAVTVAAAFALGRRRQVRLLLVLLFATAVYLSFRSQREMWFVLLVGLAVLAYVGPRAAAPRPAPSARLKWAAAGVVALVVVGSVLLVNESKLEAKVAQSFPARAVECIGRRQCSGPMFNSFGWGGYLIFDLPQVPVSIDGRTMVHGQDRILRHADTLRGKGDWKTDPELARARLVVLPREATLATLLKSDHRFRLIYEDSVAVVFRANSNDSTSRKST